MAVDPGLQQPTNRERPRDLQRDVKTRTGTAHESFPVHAGAAEATVRVPAGGTDTVRVPSSATGQTDLDHAPGGLQPALANDARAAAGHSSAPKTMRDGKQLLVASKVFAREHRGRSWWYLSSTLAVLAALLAIASWQQLSLVVRIPASVLAGLVLVRLFIIYHDYEHGTILRKSKLAAVIMWLYGIFALNPPSIWNRSHNHHHKNNAKILGASIGSYPVMTTTAYRRATRKERLLYAMSRHPLTIGLGYLTIFLYGMCLRSLLANPREHYDSAISLLAHALLIAGLGFWVGWEVALLAVVLPCAIGSAMGSYLFYAQHNYPSVKLRPRAEWDYVFAALYSSSYIQMSPLMHWFTGNIGYHHVHHLNARIPFYRLPEAMQALEELRAPGTTSLLPGDVYRCLQLKLWDNDQDCMVPFPGK